MADTAPAFPASAGKKRLRDDDGDAFNYDLRLDKKARPTSLDSNLWPQDSVVGTPTPSSSSQLAGQHVYQKPKYDSDDQSSMMSEPGSPQDISMSSGDEAMDDSNDDDDDDDDTPFFSQSPEDFFQPNPRLQTSSLPWLARTHSASPSSTNTRHRVPTPIVPPQPNQQPWMRHAGVRHHVRERHPQENLSSSASDTQHRLEVPSPVDEDEVPTPPSAAEAAGSQLSMLSFDDTEMEAVADAEPVPPRPPMLPKISVDDSASLHLDTDVQRALDMESAVEFSPAEPSSGVGAYGQDPGIMVVRKQRQRSGALSSGHSPVRGGGGGGGEDAGAAVRRGLSIGFRADCDKCVARTPGHMNHFVS